MFQDRGVQKQAKRKRPTVLIFYCNAMLLLYLYGLCSIRYLSYIMIYEYSTPF